MFASRQISSMPQRRKGSSMTSRTKDSVYWILAACCVCVALVAGVENSASAESRVGPGTPELTTQWWQWAMAAPPESNPVRDQTGTHCAVGQEGNVWFLAGGFGPSKVRRSCEIPHGKRIFFPVINMVYWPRSEQAEPCCCEHAKEQAALNNDSAIDLYAEIDAVPVESPKRFRVASRECFDIFLRRAESDGGYRAYPSATDGYWLLLEPLPPGRHSLKFGGRYNRESTQFGHSVQDIEYELTIL
jgi:hypothetical protein